MKTPLLICLILIFCLVTVRGDVPLGIYTITPAFTHTLDVNPLTELGIVAAGAKEIAKTCEGSSDRVKCIATETLRLRTSQLSWYLGACPNDNEIETFYRQLTGVLAECNQAVSSVCGCGQIKVANLQGSKIQLRYIGSSTRVELIKDGTIVRGYSRDIPILINEYNPVSRQSTIIAGFSFDERECRSRGYCDYDSLHLVATQIGTAFLKDADSTNLPLCEFANPNNFFEMCVQSTSTVTQTQVDGTTSDALLTYRFALGFESKRNTVDPSRVIDTVVLAEIEAQIAKQEYVFSTDSERENFREYVLASAFRESPGFKHFDSTTTSGVVEHHDGGSCTSIGYGAMQMTDSSTCPFHPDCFNRGGSGVCSSSLECLGTTALDMKCNVAAGVRFHYNNYQLAKRNLPVQHCGGGLDASQLTMKYYNAGYQNNDAGCDYVEIIEDLRSSIFV